MTERLSGSSSLRSWRPRSTNLVSGQKSETRMTTSVLKQDPNTEKVQKNAVCEEKTQRANFWGNPLCQAAKRHLNNS